MGRSSPPTSSRLAANARVWPSPGDEGLNDGVGEIAVQVTVLGSGSGGNATLLSHRDTRVLVDVGLSYREVAKRLAAVEQDPAEIDAIFITHGHGDHTRGARLFSRRHEVPVYTTPGVREEWTAPDLAEWRPLIPARSLELGALRFHPFSIPHDCVGDGRVSDRYPRGSDWVCHRHRCRYQPAGPAVCRLPRPGHRIESCGRASARQPVRCDDADTDCQRAGTSVERSVGRLRAEPPGAGRSLSGVGSPQPRQQRPLKSPSSLVGRRCLPAVAATSRWS